MSHYPATLDISCMKMKWCFCPTETLQWWSKPSSMLALSIDSLGGGGGVLKSRDHNKRIIP